MRTYLAATAAAVTLLLSVPTNSTAMTVGTTAGIQQSLAETSMTEQVRRVCRRNWFTGRERCWTDRSRPPTVCHRIRGTNRMDCY